MFSEIPLPMLTRMKELEAINARDRRDGSDRFTRLLQITPNVGKFIALMAASSPPGRWIEIGTSAGYSTLWLSLACRAVGGRLTTFEVLPNKALLARQTFSMAGVEDVIEFVHDDARKHLKACTGLSFCFMDAEKTQYLEYYETVVPNLVPGGLLVADNAINHARLLRTMLDRALSDDRVDALIVPIGNGELVCRKK